MAEDRETFEGWAILELMGHRRLGGYLGETEIAGSAFIRIDVPAPRITMPGDEPTIGRPDDVAATQFYAPSAVYCITPTTEKMARTAAAVAKVEPVAEWEARWAQPELERGDVEDAELAEPF